jgi:hypothetical protein
MYDRRLLCFDRSRSLLLAPSNVQPSEYMHSKPFVIDADCLRGWPENIALHISIVKWAAVFAAENIFVARLAARIR